MGNDSSRLPGDCRPSLRDNMRNNQATWRVPAILGILSRRETRPRCSFRGGFGLFEKLLGAASRIAADARRDDLPHRLGHGAGLVGD